jgi:hypothetical protein
MNRRNFLTCVALTPVLSTNLMAEDNDIYLTPDEFLTISSLNIRLKRLKSFVGFANFNLISYKQALYYGRNYSKIGAFTQKEIGMIERLFDETPYSYGFYGEKTCMNLDNTVSKKDVKKIPYTGHYLFRGKAEDNYKKLVTDVGNSIILTSGVRNVMKQMSLYVNKIYNCGGNMTKATISIAPPAYSYHTISDFDVGRRGWGYKNFTADFALTNEFQMMTKLDYISMRYTMNNRDGVRFEPWHVEII